MVIGGTSLFGGRGSIIGTLFGALIVGVFRNGLALSGLEVLWQDFAVGVLIIVAVDASTSGSGRSRHERRPATTPVLEARGLIKRYGRVVALDNADFDLQPNEILARHRRQRRRQVDADQGAGGAVIPDAGEMLLDGQPVHFRSPIEARNAGIETVYQNLALSPALSIADNLFLGREMRKTGSLGQGIPPARPLRHAARWRASKLSELGLMTIQNINQSVETLSGGQRQGVAVARAAAFGSRVIIMDEPTAALGVKESRAGAGADARRETARPADRADLAQHAACVRGRRPHPHPPARPAHVRHQPQGILRCRTPSPS